MTKQRRNFYYNRMAEEFDFNTFFCPLVYEINPRLKIKNLIELNWFCPDDGRKDLSWFNSVNCLGYKQEDYNNLREMILKLCIEITK